MIHSLLTLRKLLRAAKEHREVEGRVEALFQQILEPRYRGELTLSKNSLTYLQRNFFSSLFLSLYEAIGIPAERRLFYGSLNHCIRGLVTGTDNLLDNEYKELLPFQFPEKAIRFKSVMHILCFDRIIETLVRQAADRKMIGVEDIGRLHQEIFHAMVPIGAEEALEEGGVAEILTPEDILKSVHMYKGGKLLCLAFVAPLAFEKKNRDLLRMADAGIYKIGMALQVIDDITDLHEDVEAAHHNYLVSAVHHEGSPSERKILARIQNGTSGDREPVEKVFQQTLTLVMARAIGEAAEGFADLAKAGYWFHQKQSLRIVRFLFQIRGVGHLLPFFPKPHELLRLSGTE